MKYEAVIGLETHIQVRTASKMFCSCPNEFGADPNTLVCPVCMGYPGVLPVPNREAIQKTVRAGLLTGCEIARKSKFDRKSYFYPDMPKNYQISQYDLPFCERGNVRIGGGKGFSGAELPERSIRLTRIHLEEDVAKLNHYAGVSGVDYNRAGVPLMEAVSEPDMHTADEVYAYLGALKEIMQYGGIGDCDMEKGQMRFDVNVSIRPAGEEKLGTKIEIKNLNSMRAAHAAVDYEIWRQQRELEAGRSLRQETRGWNDERQETYVMRTKEQAHDYRYFPDPDLMVVEFSDADIEAIRRELPELPDAMRGRLAAAYGLAVYDAEVLTQDRAVAAWFEAAAVAAKKPKLVANWIISELLRELGEAKQGIADCRIKPAELAELTDLIDEGTISGKIAKDMFGEMFVHGGSPRRMVADRGLAQVSDEGTVAAFVEQAIRDNPTQVEQIKGGNDKVIQYLVGQVMKQSKGKANPQLVVKLLRDRLR
jgi:aspartyl-tRNA(Asn)/glutamyl-tRNA(Gln) amidotransferase subunit B